MIWLFVALSAVAVVAIAVVAVGRVTSSLSRTPRTTVYDLARATDYVVERLPDEVAARLGRDDVQSLLVWHLTWLRSRGVATYGRVDELSAEALRKATGPIVADEDDAVDAILERAGVEGADLDALDVVVVLDLDAAYLRSIGAVGDAVEGPDPPTDIDEASGDGDGAVDGEGDGEGEASDGGEPSS